MAPCVDLLSSIQRVLHLFRDLEQKMRRDFWPEYSFRVIGDYGLCYAIKHLIPFRCAESRENISIKKMKK
jgi:hypothetical protein